MVADLFNPNTLEAEVSDLFEFQANLVSTASSRSAMDSQWKTLSNIYIFFLTFLFSRQLNNLYF